MPKIAFEAVPFTINSWTILKFPKAASAKLPSRGMAMVEGTINGFEFHTPLEPDGKGSHWFKIYKSLQKSAKLAEGKTATLSVEPMKEWPDPKVPADWKSALAKNPQQQKLWNEITPIARWDWIRWIGMSKNPETRKKHIEVALSKMKAGERRPCCFNRSFCTEPAVANGGVLIEPANVE
jgi:Bacteriocin-protection, YdeI or OmpD-Associated/Domain of unknown function (DUF1905)